MAYVLVWCLIVVRFESLRFLSVLQGFVYLKFASGQGASAAQKALNGRWFAGRQIAADFQFPAVYNNHFRL